MTVEDVAEAMLNLMAAGKADQIVICQGEDMGWDNIKEIHDNGVTVNIVFGGYKSFSPADVFEAGYEKTV